MRRRLALLLSVAVLGTGLALPGAAAASTNVTPDSGYVYKVIYNYCSADGSYMKVKEIAKGYTPANYLTMKIVAQERRGGRWKTVHKFSLLSYSFTPNGSNHWLTGWADWTNHVYYVRLKFKLRVWRNGTLLAKKNLISKVC
jgi:hypothetical protein